MPKTIKFRAATSKLCHLIDKLKDDPLRNEKECAIKETGFGGLLQVQKYAVGRVIATWLVDHFNHELSAIELANGSFLKITKKDVARVYGLPNGERKLEIHSESAIVVRTLCKYLNLPFNKAKYVKVTDIEKSLSVTSDPEKFAKLFVLLSIGSLLCCVNNLNVPLRLYVSVLLNPISMVKEFNWCDHVLFNLRKELNNPRAAKFCNGDLHLLMIHFLDMVAYDYNLPCLLMSPMCALWNCKRIHKRILELEEHGGYGKGVIIGDTSMGEEEEDDDPQPSSRKMEILVYKEKRYVKLIQTYTNELEKIRTELQADNEAEDEDESEVHQDMNEEEAQGDEADEDEEEYDEEEEEEEEEDYEEEDDEEEDEEEEEEEVREISMVRDQKEDLREKSFEEEEMIGADVKQQRDGLKGWIADDEYNYLFDHLDDLIKSQQEQNQQQVHNNDKGKSLMLDDMPSCDLGVEQQSVRKGEGSKNLKQKSKSNLSTTTPEPDYITKYMKIKPKGSLTLAEISIVKYAWMRIIIEREYLVVVANEKIPRLMRLHLQSLDSGK